MYHASSPHLIYATILSATVSIPNSTLLHPAACPPPPHNQPLSTHSQLPAPSPLSTTPDSHHDPSEFELCFRTGNISVCSGCCTNFTEVDDVVVRHAEYRMFNNPHTGLLMSRYGNAYYHAKLRCFHLRWGNSSEHSLVTHDNVHSQLSVAHKM